MILSTSAVSNKLLQQLETLVFTITILYIQLNIQSVSSLLIEGGPVKSLGVWLQYLGDKFLNRYGKVWRRLGVGLMA